MTTRYNLRSRRASVPGDTEPSVPGEFLVPKLENLESVPGGHSLSGTESARPRSPAAVRPGLLYSRVVSPAPSPLPVAPVTPSSPSPVLREGTQPFTPVPKRPSSTVGVSRLEEAANELDPGWRQVSYARRSRSMDSPSLARESSTRAVNRLIGPSPIPAPVFETVKAAEQALSAGDRDRIARRFQAIREERALERSDSQRGGPSNVGIPVEGKGKGVDPRNWGNVSIASEELDVEVQRRKLESFSNPQSRLLDENGQEISVEEQRQALEYWRARRAVPTKTLLPAAGPSLVTGIMPAVSQTASPSAPAPSAVQQNPSPEVERITAMEREMASLRAQLATASVVSHNSRTRSGKTVRLEDGSKDKASEKPVSAYLKPITEIEPGSYLGRAFRTLEKRLGEVSEDSDDHSPPSSPPDSSSEGGSEPSSSSEDSREGRRRKKKKSKRSRVPVLKPKEPEPYDGSLDVQKFHKFMAEATEYIRGYELERKRHAITVSNFLTGKAYDFYVNSVSKKPWAWTLKNLFMDLFNYCFPIDFRLKMRAKFNRCKQGERTVREFVHELDGLAKMSGVWSERDRVDKLWSGLSFSIQRELWRKGLTPTAASWDDVRAAAEIEEIASNVGPSMSSDRRSTKGGKLPFTSAVEGERAPTRKQVRSRPRRGDGAAASGAGVMRGSNGPRPSTAASQQRVTARPLLSDKERAELQAAGKCFVCKQTGHMSRNCPEMHKVRSNRSGRAPGLTSFSVHPDFGAVDELRTLVDSTAPMDAISLNHVDVITHPAERGSGDGCRCHIDTPHSLSTPCCRDQREGSLHDGRTAPTSPFARLAEQRRDMSEDYVVLPITTREGRYPSALEDVHASSALRALRKHAPYCCVRHSAEGSDTRCEADDIYYVMRVSDEFYAVAWDGAPNGEFLIAAEHLEDEEFDVAWWFRLEVAQQLGHPHCLPTSEQWGMSKAGTVSIAREVSAVLTKEIEHPTKGDPDDPWSERFRCTRTIDGTGIKVRDAYLGVELVIPETLLRNRYFDLANFYARQVRKKLAPCAFGRDEQWSDFVYSSRSGRFLELNAVSRRAVHEPILHLQRNAGTPRDFRRIIPEPVVVVVEVNGHPARALLDSGSLADFMSAKLAHQLGVKTFELEKPLPVHLCYGYPDVAFL